MNYVALAVAMITGAVVFGLGIAAGWRFREYAEDYYFGDRKGKPDA